MDPTMPPGGAPPGALPPGGPAPGGAAGGGLEMFLTPMAMQMLSPQEQAALGQAFAQKAQQMQQPQGGPQGAPPPGGLPPPGGDPRAQMARALGGM